MSAVREAREEDGPMLAQFFLETPMKAGTEFVLDRSPDFRALLRLRGRSRTFVAMANGRIAGTISVVWHDCLHEAVSLCVGEIVDLRVAPDARGGTLTARLLAAAREAFGSERTDFVTCLIGENNHDARRLVAGKAGFPSLQQVARYASVHFPAVRLPAARNARGLSVRPAVPDDAQLLAGLVSALRIARPFSPPDLFPWPDPSACHRAWIAMNGNARAVGALVAWDGQPVRRIRVTRYTAGDNAVRALMALLSLAGMAAPLPPPGGAMRVWASRWIGAVGNDRETVRALVRAALRSAAVAGNHLLQMNLGEDDPLLQALPRLPHSVYWTTVYACAFDASESSMLRRDGPMCFADLALV